MHTWIVQRLVDKATHQGTLRIGGAHAPTSGRVRLIRVQHVHIQRDFFHGVCDAIVHQLLLQRVAGDNIVPNNPFLCGTGNAILFFNLKVTFKMS